MKMLWKAVEPLVGELEAFPTRVMPADVALFCFVSWDSKRLEEFR